MKRIIFACLLTAFFAVGCADEQTTGDDESEQTSDGVRVVGVDSRGDEQLTTDHTGQKTHGGPCPGCGPVPDPWKTVAGPVPDPWTPAPSGSDPSTSSSGGGGSGSGGGSNKP